MDDHRDNWESEAGENGSPYSDAYYREAPQDRRGFYGYSPAQCYARASGEPSAAQSRRSGGNGAALFTAACLVCVLLAGVLGAGGMYLLLRSGADDAAETASDRDLYEAAASAAQEKDAEPDADCLGLHLAEVTPGAARYYELVRGVYVSSVEDGSCSETAGLRAGDVITAVDGTEIDSPDLLVRQLRSHGAGDSVAVTVWREQEYVTVAVLIDTVP